MKDRFNRNIDYLRLSVTDKCNLRCVYCMEKDFNGFFKEESLLKDEEILRIVKECAALGVKKVRITGGEPLVRKNIVELIGKINKLQGIEEIYMTTNGILLFENLEKLAENGLKGISVSLDSLDSKCFREITAYGDMEKVLKSIDKAISLGIKVKINTVLTEDINKREWQDFVNLTLNKKVDVRFIELMPIGVGKNFKTVSNQVIKDKILSLYGDVSESKRNKLDGPAKYIKLKGALGRVGFISAMSECFCSECNRIRVTCDGKLKQCLHYKSGVDLKKILEVSSDEELREVIKISIYTKPEKHNFNKLNAKEETRNMNEIGG